MNCTPSLMTERTTISFGDHNYGLQVGPNSGSITAEFYLPPERPETPPKPSSTIPFRRDHDFVERKTILDRLYQTNSTPASRVALVGLGGVGKSQIAIEHAYRVRDAFPQENNGIWVFWVHASTRLRAEQGFRIIADTVKIPGRGQPKADILQLVYQWLQNEHNGRWLMVLDSADDIEVFYSIDQHGKRASTTSEEKRAIWMYLPQSSNGSILITTRNRDLAFKLTGHQNNNIIDVRPMDDAHALELLAKRVESQFEEADGKELVKALEYMPLAISQAAAYIQQRAPRTSIKSYLEDFQRSESKQLGFLHHDVGDLRRDSDVSNSTIITWQISFDHICSKRPSATDLLSFISFFDHQSIPEFLVRPIHSDDGSIGPSEDSNSRFEEDIKTLRDYCLISMNKMGDTFEMHRLVQLSTRTWLDVHKETEKFKKHYITLMAKKFPNPPEFSNWETCRNLFPHVERAIHYEPVDEESLMEWALIMQNGGWYSLQQGRCTIAEIMAEKALNTYKAVRGAEHSNTLATINLLTSTYWEQKRYQEAELLGTQVIEINRRVQGLEHPDTLISMSNLALTYSAQGRWEEAESLKSRVLKGMKKTLGPDHPDTLTSMHNLAWTYMKQGRWEEAESLIIEVVEKLKEVLRPDHPDTLTSMHNLAWTYMKQGRWEKAESLIIEVVEKRKEVLRPSHPDTLISMHNLARIYLKQGRWEEAESLLVPLTETSKAVLGPDNPFTLNIMFDLAYTHNGQGHKHKAFELMDQCAQAHIRVLGPEHPHTQVALSRLQEWREEDAMESAKEVARCCSIL